MADQKERMQNAGKFQEAIFDYAKLQSEQILQELQQKQQEELKCAKETIQQEMSLYIQHRLEKVNSEMSREIAHREQDVKQDILKQRREITNQVFEDAKKRLLDFTQTEEYLPFLLKQVESIKELYAVDDAVFVIKQADERYQEDLQKAFGRPCQFQTDAAIQIGGLQVKSTKLGKMVDQSLDSLLCDQHDWFALYSDLSVI
ncbi:V-type ATP synthase subunit E [Scatolibacter rhodanostii]|uniref:V-type ATP synthase subunit E n=1 Tax=Scatolibacter rhodanostii TaxID=2014781 RepID=UPI000C06E6D7|nr:hypothetical protein [Scatolibacter rhodanostii]